MKNKEKKKENKEKIKNKKIKNNKKIKINNIPTKKAINHKKKNTIIIQKTIYFLINYM